MRGPTTNRYRPNEPTSPVPLELLATLLRSDDARVADIILQLPDNQRAALAIYCFSRAHLRFLGIPIARDCSARFLKAAGGVLGETLSDLATNGEAFDVGPVGHVRKKVTLAKFAA